MAQGLMAQGLMAQGLMAQGLIAQGLIAQGTGASMNGPPNKIANDRYESAAGAKYRWMEAELLCLGKTFEKIDA